MTQPVRAALLGAGTIGRALLKLTQGNPMIKWVALGDTSGAVAKEKGFTENEVAKIVGLKESGGRIKDYDGKVERLGDMEEALGNVQIDALVDATASQTFDLLYRALGYASVVTANKIPVADIKYRQFERLVSKARDEGRVLDIGTTVGAGMRIPDVIAEMGSNGVDRLTGP